MIYLVKLFLGILFINLVVFSPCYAIAQEESTSSTKTVFEAFWPLTAGKTIDDPLYFLKLWKENLRGVIIFGNPQKAEYAVFLGTKRVLEAEKLIKEGKKDFAEKTLSKASEEFSIARKNIEDAKSNKRPLGSSEATMRTRLENLLNLLPLMQSNLIGEVLQKVRNLHRSL